MPTPLKLMAAGTVPLTVSSALNAPVAVGVNWTAMLQLLPGFNVLPAQAVSVFAVMANPVPVSVTVVVVIGVDPVFK
jgi:hypothetical protein